MSTSHLAHVAVARAQAQYTQVCLNEHDIDEMYTYTGILLTGDWLNINRTYGVLKLKQIELTTQTKNAQDTTHCTLHTAILTPPPYKTHHRQIKIHMVVIAYTAILNTSSSKHISYYSHSRCRC